MLKKCLNKGVIVFLFAYCWSCLSLFPLYFAFQLDLCQKMACHSKRTPAWYAMWVSFFDSMDDCRISYCGSYNMGKLVDCDIGPGFDWFGCYNGGYCSLVGFLLNHALVENPVAKLKYVLFTRCSRRNFTSPLPFKELFQLCPKVLFTELHLSL